MSNRNYLFVRSKTKIGINLTLCSWTRRRPRPTQGCRADDYDDNDDDVDVVVVVVRELGHEDTYIKYYDEEELRTLICSKLDARWKKNISVTTRPQLKIYSLLSKTKNRPGHNGKQISLLLSRKKLPRPGRTNYLTNKVLWLTVTCLVTEVCRLAMAVRYGIAAEMNNVKKVDSCGEIREGQSHCAMYDLDGHNHKTSKALQSELSTVR